MDQASKRVVLIHVLKTGGTSLSHMVWESERSARGNYPGPADFTTESIEDRMVEMRHLYLMNPFLNAALSPARLSEIGTVSGHFSYTMARRFDPAVFVTMLRDPVERVISHLRGLQADQGDSRPLTALYREQDQSPFPYLDNLQTRVFASVATDVPTVLHDFSPVTGDSLQRAKAHLSNVDVVGLMEHFTESVRLIERATGRRLGEPVHENRSSRVELVPQALREEIEERNHADRELYRFAATLFERQRGEIAAAAR